MRSWRRTGQRWFWRAAGRKTSSWWSIRGAPASLTIANHYAELRQIPSTNLLFLPWNPKFDTTDVDTFRRQILIPILKTIESRNLSDQIDCVVYSSDFPWGIGLDGDFRRFTTEMQCEVAAKQAAPADKSGAKPGQKQPAITAQWPQYLTPVGSLNGLTYLWEPVARGLPDYLSMDSNSYMRRPIPQRRDAPATAFRGNRQYNQQGEAVVSGGRRYLLSMMLGVTAGRGNTLREVIDYLRRSAKADGTHPQGTIYFMKSNDVALDRPPGSFSRRRRPTEATRRGCRNPRRDDPAESQRRAGGGDGHSRLRLESLRQRHPARCDLRQLHQFWRRDEPGRRPDAAVGVSPLRRSRPSGTVTEPYAIAAKFPSPMSQVYYARGCTLAEAFYQSVSGPYQLLLVGDPLCQLWAQIPQVSVTGIKSGAVVRGELTLYPSATLAHGAAVDRLELFVDGVRWGACKPGENFPLNTASLADGYHELRAVAVGPRPIESQGRKIIPIQVNNHDRRIEASLATPQPLRADRPVTIAVHSPGSTGILVIRGVHVLGQIAGQEGKIDIPANTLGCRPGVPAHRRFGQGRAADVRHGQAIGVCVGMIDHDRFMQIALEEAEQALREDEVPIGAAIVHDGRPIARCITNGSNSTIRRPTPK